MPDMQNASKQTEDRVFSAGESALAGSDQGESVIRTMPEEFLTSAEPSGSKKPMLIVGVIVGGVVLVGIIIWAVIVLNQGDGRQPEQPLAPAVVETPLSEEELEQPAEITEVPAESEPEIVPTVIEEPEKREEDTTIPSGVLSNSQDSDQDNLTDVEEVLFNTDIQKPDSDGDGYLDGQEVENLYNPRGTAPVLIKDSGLVGNYINATYRYSIYYPVSWVAKALDETNQEVMFTAATGELVQVIVQENPQKLTALNWYAAQFPEIGPSRLERVFIENLEGVWSQERSTVYLTKAFGEGKNDYIYAISYNTGNMVELNFRATFKMMINSFRIAAGAKVEPVKKTESETKLSALDRSPTEFVKVYLDAYKTCDINTLRGLSTGDYWQSYSEGKIDKEVLGLCYENIKDKVTYQIVKEQDLGTNIFDQPIASVLVNLCIKIEDEEDCGPVIYWLTAFDNEWRVSNAG